MAESELPDASDDATRVTREGSQPVNLAELEPDMCGLDQSPVCGTAG